jgi:hypothetical protein
MTSALFAQALTEFLGFTVTGLTDEQWINFMDGKYTPPSNGRWVYVEGDSTSWGHGFNWTKIDEFYGQNYYNLWASKNSVPQSFKFEKGQVTFQNASNPNWFDMRYWAEQESLEYPDWYKYSFDSLVDLKTATLVLERDWEYCQRAACAKNNWMDCEHKPVDKGVLTDRFDRGR